MSKIKGWRRKNIKASDRKKQKNCLIESVLLEILPAMKGGDGDRLRGFLIEEDDIKRIEDSMTKKNDVIEKDNEDGR